MPHVSVRTIALAIVAALILITVLAVLAAFNGKKASRMAAEGTLAAGRTSAAQDASGVRDGADKSVSDIHTNVETGTDAIRQADTPAARDDASLRSLCRVNSGASPKCGMLNANR